jgi:oligopeptide/dipeptide ABC transporter ATP-binding protein
MAKDELPLLEIEKLKIHFFLEEGTVRAVNGASLTLRPGETLGIVGESGCGKSVMARAILGLVSRPGRIVEGSILYHRMVGNTRESIDLAVLDPRSATMRAIRGLEITMIFQEPMSAMTPVYTIGEHITETIRLHQDVSKSQARDQAIQMLASVGMPDPPEIMRRYPHQVSGGMCQRAMIAMALSSYPSLLIADEPTTALDVTTEAQILELMRGLQAEFGMAILFITHNLGVIAQMADRVIVVYLGQVVEEADVYNLFHHPLHPYTRALLNSVPRLGQRDPRRRLLTVRGMLPNVFTIPDGCPFHPRCPEMRPGLCDEVEPPWLVPDIAHGVRCVLYQH